MVTLDWVRQAACRGADPGLFFPSAASAVPAEAAALCASCPVSSECLGAAGEYGVWGGRSERDRGAGRLPARRIKKRPTRALAMLNRLVDDVEWLLAMDQRDVLSILVGVGRYRHPDILRQALLDADRPDLVSAIDWRVAS